jgi:hypothetical protein
MEAGISDHVWSLEELVSLLDKKVAAVKKRVERLGIHLIPAGQEHFIRKTRPQMIFWRLVILSFLGLAGYIFYQAFSN